MVPGSRRRAAAALVLAAGCLLVPRAAPQEARQHRRIVDPEVRAHVEELGRSVARSIARIRAYRVLDVRHQDGTLITRREFEEGIIDGLVVADGALVLASAAAPYLTNARVRQPARPRHEGLSERRYALLLESGRTVPFALKQEIPSLNMVLLGPAEDVTGDSLPPPLDLAVWRRPQQGEMIGLVFVVRQGEALIVETLVRPLGPDKEHYLRPVVGMGGGRLGAPVISADGALLGVLNLQRPEDRPVQESREPAAASSPATPAGEAVAGTVMHDPLAWRPDGEPMPVLITGEELRPVLEQALAAGLRVVDYAPLGLRLEIDWGRPRIGAVAPDGPAARAGLEPGDLLLAFGGREIRSTEDFEAALEAALGDGTAPRLELTVRRQGVERQVEIVP